MRTVVSVSSVLACAFSLDAQITTTFNRLPNGLDEVRIRNDSATSLVAFVVSVKQTPRSSDSPPALDLGAGNAPFVVYSGPLIEPGARPLQASEERVATVSGAVSFRQTSFRRLSSRCRNFRRRRHYWRRGLVDSAAVAPEQYVVSCGDGARMCYPGPLLRRTHSPARGMDGPEDEGPPAATLEASYNHHRQRRKASLLGPPSEMSRH